MYRWYPRDPALTICTPSTANWKAVPPSVKQSEERSNRCRKAVKVQIQHGNSAKHSLGESRHARGHVLAMPRTPSYSPTSPRSLAKHAICALFAASATRLKSCKNGAVAGVPPPSPL